MFEPLPKSLAMMIEEARSKGSLNPNAITSMEREKQGFTVIYVACTAIFIYIILFMGEEVILNFLIFSMVVGFVFFLQKNQMHRRQKLTFLYTYGERSPATIVSAAKMTGLYSGWAIQFTYKIDDNTYKGGKLHIRPAFWPDPLPTGTTDANGNPYIILHHPDIVGELNDTNIYVNRMGEYLRNDIEETMYNLNKNQ